MRFSYVCICLCTVALGLSACSHLPAYRDAGAKGDNTTTQAGSADLAGQDIQSVLYDGDSGDATVIDAVAISVNGHIITASEIFYPISATLSELARGSTTHEEFIRDATGVLQNEILRQIGQVLVEQDAEEKLSEAELNYLDTQVEEHIKVLALKAGGSMNKLAEDLAADGTSIEAVKTTSRRELLSRYYVRQKLAPKLKFTRREVMKYYDSHPDEFSSEAQAQMQIMFFPFNQHGGKAGAVEAAKKVCKRLGNGEDFTEIIKSESETSRYRAKNGGLWDMMPLKSFGESEVEKVAFEQGKGNVSEPITSQKGVFIVKTVDYIAPKNISFEDAQQQITAELTEQRNSRLAIELYNRLQQQADIRHNLDFQQYAIKLAVDIYFAANDKTDK